MTTKTDSSNTANQTAGTTKSTSGRNREDRTKWFFILPAAIWVLVFTIFPLLYALYTSFWSFRFGTFNQFVGLDNYMRLFTDRNLHWSLYLTVIYVVVTVTIQMTLGFGLAILFNREIRGKNVIRALMVLPLFATPVAMGYLGITMYYEVNGPINSFLHALGFEGIPWLSDPYWALVSIMIIDIWQWTPFVFLVSLAGLQGLPEDIYEAARVDGGSGWQLFRNITFPLMTPILWLILLLRLVEAFKIFDIPATLTLGGPGRATEIYSLFTYRTALRFFDHGFAATQGILLLVIVMFIVTILFNRIRGIYDVPR